MKLKVTDKELARERYVFISGYCDLQYLLKYESPIAYASGVNGWRYDVFKLDNVYVTTGYASPRGCNMRLPKELKEEFEIKLSQAQKKGREEYVKELANLANKLREYAKNWNK